MSIHLDIVSQIRIASPCNVGWDNMRGDNRVRHCDQCNLSVHSLEEMTRAEVEALLLNSQGRVCGHIRRRMDGTIILKDCPVGIAAVRARVRRGAARAVAFASFLFTASVLYARGKEDPQPETMLFHLQPFKWAHEVLKPTPPQTTTWDGRMGVP